jgi:hypothetical protein
MVPFRSDKPWKLWEGDPVSGMVFGPREARRNEDTKILLVPRWLLDPLMVDEYFVLYSRDNGGLQSSMKVNCCGSDMKKRLGPEILTTVQPHQPAEP